MVEGPVGVEVVLVEAGTVDWIVVTLVSGPPGSELDNAEDADEADEAEDAEDADALSLAVVETEGAVESDERERDGERSETETEPVGRREDREEGMDAVVRGSVTEAVMLLAAELAMVVRIERGSVIDGMANEDVVWSSVDVVRRTPVSVRGSVSVPWRATRFAASALRRPSGAAETTAAKQKTNIII